MNTAPRKLSLVDLAASLRKDDDTLFSYLNQLERDFNSREPSVLAFVPEENRFARLRRDARALIARYPDANARPPLFGVPVGVKAIFHVDGLETHAGSRLPKQELQ